MERGKAQLIALVEKRLQRLKSLAKEIQAAQEACIVLDLEALRGHDSQKEHLCTEIRRLDREISEVVREFAPAGSLRVALAAAHAKEGRREAATDRQLNVLFEESEAARAEVVRLNRVYAQFLARSRNTLKVMINVVSHCLGVYPSPQPSAYSAAPFERSY